MNIESMVQVILLHFLHPPSSHPDKRKATRNINITMTEADLATRAPESDAQEGQGAAAPGDAADQNGPAMSEHCTTDRPTRM